MWATFVGRIGRLVLASCLGLIIVPVGLLRAAPDACACSCAMVSLADKLQGADVVFRGRAVSRSNPLGLNTAEEIVWQFDVSEVYRGEVYARQGVWSAVASASCGADFEIGRDYLVVARVVAESGGGTARDARPRTGLCAGNQSASRDAIADVRALLGQPHRPLDGSSPMPQAHAVRSVAITVGVLLAAGAVLLILIWRTRRRHD